MKTAILALALAICGSVYAQPSGGRGAVNTKSPEERKEMMRQRIESQKVAYITQKLELTPEEAQTFWPVYNEYKAQKERLREEDSDSELVNHFVKDEDAETEKDETPLSAEELDAQMRAKFARERERIDLDERYFEKYKTVLPAEKVDALYRAERSFKREMMRRMRDGRGRGGRDNNKDYKGLPQKGDR